MPTDLFGEGRPGSTTAVGVSLSVSSTRNSRRQKYSELKYFVQYLDIIWDDGMMT